ncbi:Uncharacterized protein PBTT_03249 [Plasmodiophora brassicae]
MAVRTEGICGSLTREFQIWGCLSILASAIWIVWRIVPAGVPITFDQDAAFKAVEVIETVVWFISGALILIAIWTQSPIGTSLVSVAELVGIALAVAEMALSFFWAQIIVVIVHVVILYYTWCFHEYALEQQNLAKRTLPRFHK